MTSGLHTAYLAAAESAVELLEDPAVAERWDQPSALPGMTVGALAAHLGSEVLLLHQAATDPVARSTETPVPLLEHYNRSAWVTGGHDDDANVSIRDGAERSAEPGAEAVRSDVRAALDELRELLAGGTLPPVVRMPWWGWSLSFDDFVVTRMMEITVHSDDLAVSLGVEPPVLPGTVLEPVLSLLVGVAVMRHGQAAVVRALSRAERAEGSISAF